MVPPSSRRSAGGRSAIDIQCEGVFRGFHSGFPLEVYSCKAVLWRQKNLRRGTLALARERIGDDHLLLPQRVLYVLCEVKQRGVCLHSVDLNLVLFDSDTQDSNMRQSTKLKIVFRVFLQNMRYLWRTGLS